MRQTSLSIRCLTTGTLWGLEPAVLATDSIGWITVQTWTWGIWGERIMVYSGWWPCLSVCYTRHVM